MRIRDSVLRKDEEAIWSLVESYLGWHHGNGPGRGLSSNTARAYRRALAILLARWEPSTILNPPPEAGKRLAEALVAEGMSQASVKVYVAGMRALYRALRWVGVTWSAPFAGLSTTPETGGPSRGSYSEAEIDALLDAAEPFDRLLVLLAVDGSLRASECVSIRWSNVDLAKGEVAIDAGRSVLMTDRLRRAFQNLAPRDDADRIFPYASAARARDRLADLCRRAGVTYRGLDALRRTAATHLPAAPRGEGRAHPDEGKAAIVAGSRHDSLIDEVRRAIQESERLGAAFVVAVVKVDGLERISDLHGAEILEAVWQAISDRVRARCRPYDRLIASDPPCLYVLVKHLPRGTPPARLIDRFRRAVEDHPLSVQGWRDRLRASVTVAHGDEVPG